MKKNMSIAGVGPRFAIYSIIFSIVLFIIDNLTNPFFKINFIPHLYMLIAGISFLIIGIPFFLLSVKTISKVYGQTNIYTLGVYSVCRHPLYSSFIFFTVPGIVLFFESWILLLIPFIMYLIFIILIKEEEKYLKTEFGTQYTNYKNKVSLVFPKLWKFKNFIIIIGLVFLGSCNSNKEQNKLTGNWYSCANNGDYIEMFVTDNQYRYSANYGVITPWYQFKISGDTLIQFDKYIIEDTIIIHKAIIELIDDTLIKLNYLTSDETWILYKIDKEININLNDSSILKGTLKRSLSIKCIDYRTDDEKEKDKPLKEIDFQF